MSILYLHETGDKNVAEVRLALGTAQFGMPYGIKNRRGAPEDLEISQIFELAQTHGVECLDTAVAYGNSEERIGYLLGEKKSKFKIISKFSEKTGTGARAMLLDSLSRLRIDRLYAYMFHSYEHFQSHPEQFNELLSLKSQGLVEKVGFSLYHPHEYHDIVERGIKVDIVQVPFSVLDQRFLPLFENMRQQGTEVHVRSLFLQGLLLMEPQQMNSSFESVATSMRRVRSFCDERGLSLVSFLMAWARRQKGISDVVVGVDGLSDFQENLKHWTAAKDPEFDRFDFSALANSDLNILIPMNWKTAK